MAVPQRFLPLEARVTMRLSPFLLFLSLLAACTTTVPEPDATTRPADWRDAALVESLASDAVTAQHRLGSAGPISLPASFLTPGGDLQTTGGVVTQAQAGALSFAANGQISCSSALNGCQLQEARPVSDIPTSPVFMTGQAAATSATTNPNGGGACTMGGAGATGPTSAGGPDTHAGGWSTATTNQTGGNVETILEAPAGTGTEAASIVYRAAQLTGTVSVTNASTAITFSTAQTLPAGTPLVFSGQLSLVYHLSAAITASTSGVLTSPYGGTTTAGLVVWAGTPTVSLAYAGGYGGISFMGGASQSIYGNGSTFTYVNGGSNVALLIAGVYFPIYAGSSFVDLNGSSMTAYGGTGVVNLTNGTAITSAPSGGATIQAISGALTVTAAGNTTPSATFGATTTTIAGTLDAGYVAVTPANGANTLTAAQSAVANLNLLAGATAAVTVTDALTPAAAKGALLFVRNNTTQTVTFGWSTGTTITLSTLTSALVTSDGTNAVKLMAGT